MLYTPHLEMGTGHLKLHLVQKHAKFMELIRTHVGQFTQVRVTKFLNKKYVIVKS